MLEDSRGRIEGWKTSFTQSTFCCREECNVCCKRSQGVALTSKDYFRIRKYYPDQVFAERRDHPLFPFSLRVRDNSCIFLSHTGRCNIYNHRPLLCRLYPLQIHVTWDGTLLWLREFCPGIDDPSGIAIDDRYYDNLLAKIYSLEGSAFITGLREYVLQIKRPVTSFMTVPNGMVYSEWPTKEFMWFLVLGVFYDENLENLTPRGRLESIRCDFLPAFRKYLASEIMALPEAGSYFIEEESLRRVYHQNSLALKELVQQSAEKQIVHESKLVKEGKLSFQLPDKGYGESCRNSLHTLKRLNGEKINVEVNDIMHMGKFDGDAIKSEESYIEEIIGREGRYGKELVDLSIDCKLYFLFLVADAVEIKASAFAAYNGKRAVELPEIREAVMIVERTLVELLKRVR